MSLRFRDGLGNEAARVVYIGIPLFLTALFAPFIGGFQYLEWWPSSTHLTWFIFFPLASIEHSDWVDGGWTIRAVYSQNASFPFLVFVFTIVTIRVGFALALILFDSGRFRKKHLFWYGVLLAGISAFLCISLMTSNQIWGTPPGGIAIFSVPDVEQRLVVPIPLLLVFGILIVLKSSRRGEAMNK